MKYEVLKPFSVDPGRSEVSEVGSQLIMKDAARARDLQRAGFIGTQGLALSEEEGIDAPPPVITDLTSIPEPPKDGEVEVEADADKDDEVDKENKAISGAPKNKDAASQRSVK